MFKKSILTTLTIAGLLLFAGPFGVHAQDPASPTGCNADRSVVNIARSTASASVGETITFTVEAGNPVSVVDDGCDITNRTMTLTLPNGDTQVFGPFNYPYPSALTIVGSADYVASSADLTGSSWTATVSWTGVQKDGFDSVSTGSKGTSVVYIPVTLEVTKTADPKFDRTVTWTIDKSVDTAEHTLFTGESGDSAYTVGIDKTVVESGYAVSGTITIHNPALVAADITGVSDSISDIGAVTVACPVSFPYSLAAGADLICTYSESLPDTTTRTNTATVATVGDVEGDSAQVPISFDGVLPTLVGYDQVTITDTNSAFGGPVQTSDDVTYNYDVTFLCDRDAGENPNTATIVETQQSDSALVTVNCTQILPLVVEKTASTSLTRTWEWTIDKTVTPDTWGLFGDATGVSTYTIALDKTGSVDSNWMIGGTIAITNPASNPSATITDITDSVTNVGGGTVSCPGGLAQVLAPGVTLNCTYSVAAPDGDNETNTVTVTTSGTVPGGSDDAAVDFGAATVTDVHGSASVDDTFDAGDHAAVSDDTTYTYERTFICDRDEGENPNTATIVETQQSDSALVTVTCSNPSIDIEKATNGQDADTGTGPVLTEGDPVEWTYVVTNTGDVALTGVAVSDDKLGTVTCPKNALAVGESMTCTANGVAIEGQYANIGSVDGYYGEILVEDSDPSHYFGEMKNIEYCSPGYWKQSQHFMNWNGYSPDDKFSEIFGETITIKWSSKGKPRDVVDPTLLQALQANGGGINLLARATVDALLNAALLETDMTPAEVIGAFQDVYPGTTSEYQALADIFTTEENCPLGNSVYTPPTPPQPLLGVLSPEDFGVVEYEVSDTLGTIAGYTAGFGVSDATLAGATSVVVKLYAAGDVLLQTNTAILSKFNTDITGTQFSSPFDVSGDFDYGADGYWTNVREVEYGQSMPAVKVVATVTLANTKVVTATNTTLSGDPTTIYPGVADGPDWDTTGSYVLAFNYLGSDYAHDMVLAQDGLGNLTGTGGYPAGGAHAYAWTVDGISLITDSTIHVNATYTVGASCAMTIDGTIASPSGTMSGTWSDDCDGAREGTWVSTSGAAVLVP